jgi:hypothetical protein
LLQKPVKLPFLNIELPLLAFFFLAPLLFLSTHAYTLVHLVLLANRVAQFNEELTTSPENPALWRRRLPTNIFVQFLAAPEQRPFWAPPRDDPLGNPRHCADRTLPLIADPIPALS